MNLIYFNEVPPRGWLYFEPSIGWRPSDPFQAFDVIVKELQVARYQNPASGLDSSYESCALALGLYTCKRAEGKQWFEKFCTSSELVARKAAQNNRERATCGGCGRK